MTKAELIKALENIDDNEEITFLYNGTDHDGWLEERTTRVERVEATKAYNARIRAEEVKRWEADITKAEARIAKLTAEMEDAPTKAATKRNAERAWAIGWAEETIKTRREWIEGV